MVEAVFVVVPSPKFQKRFVIVPIEVSVKVTSNGTNPLVGVPVKPATGMMAPVPRTGTFVPPPLLVRTMSLLNEPAVMGLNRTARLVEPKPATL